MYLSTEELKQATTEELCAEFDLVRKDLYKRMLIPNSAVHEMLESYEWRLMKELARRVRHELFEVNE